MAAAADLAIQLSLKGASQTSAGLKDVGGSADGLGSKLGSLGKAAVVAGAAIGVTLVAGLASCVKDAAASEQVMAQTEAVIKSTGGAAGLSAQQVADMAGSLSKVAPFDDEVIQQAENLLLTFTNIGGDVMPQATSAVLDMATALGEDTQTAAQQLGKALNDPIQGVTALQRVGVKLTDAQKDQVKAMVEAGDVAGAQGVILQELQKEFGGSAEAAGKTFAGQLQIAKTQIGNLKESIGAALIPVLLQLLPFFVEAADWLGARLPGALNVVIGFVQGLVDKLGGPLQAAFVFVRDAVLTFVQALQGDWVSASGINPVHDAIGKIGLVIREQVIPAVLSMVDFFINTILPAAQQVWGVIQTLIAAFSGEGGLAGTLERLTAILGPLADQFLTWAGGVLVMLIDQVGKWAGALIDWIAPQIPPLLIELAKIVQSIAGWARDTALPAIAAQLLVWGQALIDWIKPRIVPMLAALGDLLLQLGNWLKDTALPELGKKLAEWGAAFIAWIQPQIGPLLSELGSLLASLGDWLISTALPEIGAKLAEWAAAFVAWVAPQIPPLLVELGSLLASLGDWVVTTALPEILTKLAEWAAAFIKWVAPQIPPLLVELGSLLIALGKWVLEEALPEIVKYVAKWGEKFVSWVATDVIPELPGALADILTTIGGWILGAVFWISGEAEKLGTALIDGVKAGVASLAGSLADALKNAIQGAIDAAKDFFGIHSPSQVTHDEIGLPISQGIAEGIIAGIPAVQGALDQIAGMVMQTAGTISALMPGLGGSPAIPGAGPYTPMPPGGGPVFGGGGGSGMPGGGYGNGGAPGQSFGPSLPPFVNPQNGLGGATGGRSSMAGGRSQTINVYVEDRSPAAIAHAVQMAGMQLARTMELQGGAL